MRVSKELINKVTAICKKYNKVVFSNEYLLWIRGKGEWEETDIYVQTDEEFNILRFSVVFGGYGSVKDHVQEDKIYEGIINSYNCCKALNKLLVNLDYIQEGLLISSYENNIHFHNKCWVDIEKEEIIYIENNSEEEDTSKLGLLNEEVWINNKPFAVLPKELKEKNTIVY